MLGILEKIHEAGLVYNDLKLDNIVIGYKQDLPNYEPSKNCFENISVNLIDFGFTKPYLSKSDGKHKEKLQVDIFRVNVMFASSS